MNISGYRRVAARADAVGHDVVRRRRHLLVLVEAADEPAHLRLAPADREVGLEDRPPVDQRLAVLDGQLPRRRLLAGGETVIK